MARRGIEHGAGRLPMRQRETGSCREMGAGRGFGSKLGLSALVFVLAACSPEGSRSPSGGASKEQGATLSLSVYDDAGSRSRVALSLRGELQAPARVAEIWLAYTPNLRLVDSAAGAAVGNKAFVVQPRAGGRLRTIVYSATDLSGIGEGTVGSYVFERIGPGEATIQIVPQGQVFAPAGANEGLVVGDPLILREQ
jgi:hypothetical protein